jgi:hypothetical protein
MGCNKKYFIFTCVAVAILFIPIIAGASCTNCGKLRYLEITDVAYKENNPEKAITEFQDFIKHCPEG